MPELTERDVQEFNDKIEMLHDNPDISNEEAIKLSARKWELIAADLIVPEGAHNCALCIVNPGCATCPVAIHTGVDGCCNTPHDDWCNKPTPENARKEVEFLRSLLLEENG